MEQWQGETQNEFNLHFFPQARLNMLRKVFWADETTFSLFGLHVK